jgi:hypothetical protein
VRAQHALDAVADTFVHLVQQSAKWVHTYMSLHVAMVR